MSRAPNGLALVRLTHATQRLSALLSFRRRRRPASLAFSSSEQAAIRGRPGTWRGRQAGARRAAGRRLAGIGQRGWSALLGRDRKNLRWGLTVHLMDGGHLTSSSFFLAIITLILRNDMNRPASPLFAMTTALLLLAPIIDLVPRILVGCAAADEGIAVCYPRDAGLAKDPAVLFADDFESWGENGTQPPAGTWTVRTSPGCNSAWCPVP